MSSFSELVQRQNKETHEDMRSRSTDRLITFLMERKRCLSGMQREKTKAIAQMKGRKTRLTSKLSKINKELTDLKKQQKRLPSGTLRERQMKDEIEGKESSRENSEERLRRLKCELDKTIAERSINAYHIKSLDIRREELKELGKRERMAPVGSLGKLPLPPLNKVLEYVGHEEFKAIRSLSRKARTVVNACRNHELSPVEVLIELGEPENGIEKVSLLPINFDSVTGDGSYTYSLSQNPIDWSMRNPLRRRKVALCIQGRALEFSDLDQIYELLEKVEVCALKMDGLDGTLVEHALPELVEVLKIKKVTLEDCDAIENMDFRLEGVTDFKSVDADYGDTLTTDNLVFLRKNTHLANLDIRIKENQANNVLELLDEWEKKERKIQRWIIRGVDVNHLNVKNIVKRTVDKRLELQIFKDAKILIITEK